MDTLFISAATDPGRKRRQNQDACIARSLWSADKALLAVIDGVGGYHGGEKAAAIAKDCIEQYMQIPNGDTLTMLREAVVFANNRIVEERRNDQLNGEMCCVLTVMVADAGAACFYFVHVGDTRLYRFRNGRLQKLTRDHSLVGIKEDAGEMSEQEAMAHPHRNQILREVGSALHRLDDEGFIDYGREDFTAGDRLLLCSDGLTDMVTAEQMVNILLTDQLPGGQVNSLVALANHCGGYDNITVVLLQQQAVPDAVQTPCSPPAAAVNTTVARPVRKKSRAAAEKISIVAMLLLILVAGAGWYFVRPAVTVPVTEVRVAGTDSNETKAPVRALHTAIEGPVAPAPDTLHIAATQDYAILKAYTDSTGRPLVLLPENKNHHFAAVAITSRSGAAGDTVLVRHLRLSGFETGFAVQLPLVIQTEDLAFENIPHPFRYLFKPTEQRLSILFMNTVK